MTIEMIEAALEAMEDAIYEMIAQESIARMDARWAGDAEAEEAHTERLTSLLADHGLTLYQYEEYLGYHEEEDWSDPDWDE